MTEFVVSARIILAIMELTHQPQNKGDIEFATQGCYSLEQLPPTSFNPEDWWLVVLKGYFDGAQTADADRVTLASVSGASDEWTPVERAWKQVIADHKAPPLHTTNAYALQKEFKGWTNEFSKCRSNVFSR